MTRLLVESELPLESFDECRLYIGASPVKASQKNAKKARKSIARGLTRFGLLDLAAAGREDEEDEKAREWQGLGEVSAPGSRGREVVRISLSAGSRRR